MNINRMIHRSCRTKPVVYATLLLPLAFAAVAITRVGVRESRAETNAPENYIVLYAQQSVPADAANVIARAGGTLVHSYGEIGVALARSNNASFRNNLVKDRRIEGAAATAQYAVRVEEVMAANEGDGPPPGDLPNAPAPDTDTFSVLQWNMRQIQAPEAHAITGGSPAVAVGILDTGLDKDHPDLLPNIDFGNSCSCESGAPDLNPAAWDDRHGHGTHVGGIVAAAANGIGIVGVAPNVKLAAVKASTDEGFFFPEMVVCAFIWAGNRHLDVANNSYFVDPFLYNCRNDPAQRAIWKAVQRAVLFAMRQGVTVVAAMGNQSDDLAHPQLDVTSPDFPPGSEQEREVTNACVKIPVEIPGVIGVTADGNMQQIDDDGRPGYLKSFYSNYGVGVAQVVAPGGDSIFGRTPEAPNGRVLSTWPVERPCTRMEVDPSGGGSTYCYLQGTSMAAPHVSGVAALIISRFGNLNTPQNGKMRPGRVKAYIDQTADPQPCPDQLPPGYEAFTRPSGEQQTCEGGPGYNAWYGSGQVNALSAVTHTP